MVNLVIATNATDYRGAEFGTPSLGKGNAAALVFMQSCSNRD